MPNPETPAETLVVDERDHRPPRISEADLDAALADVASNVERRMPPVIPPKDEVA